MRLLQNTKPRPVLGVAFGADGRTLVAGGSAGIDVWNLRDGVARSLEIPAATTVYAFQPDPGCQRLYYSDQRGGGRIYDLNTGESQRFPGDEYADHHIISLAMSADGSKVAISRGGCGFNQLECWNVGRQGTLTLGWTAPSARWGMVHGLTFAPDGRTLAAVDEPESPSKNRICPITLRNAANGKVRSSFGSLPLTVGLDMRFVTAKRLVAWQQEWAETWDTSAKKRTGQATPTSRAYFRAFAVHPSGRFVATVGSDGHVREWDAASLDEIRSTKYTIGKLFSVAFSPDGRLGAAGGDKGQVVVWEVER